jgi:hypothetical protein
MRECKPVSVPKAAFIFCRYTLTVMVWAALIFQWKWMAVITCLILLLSAFLKIGRAPLIVLYTCTCNRLFKSSHEVLDENAMRFAHSLGGIINLFAVFFLYLIHEPVGWVILFCLGVIKTIGAIGFCPASKLYNCLTSDECCRFLKKSHG